MTRIVFALALAGCAPRTYVSDTAATPDVGNSQRVVAQLDGHLVRARACLDEGGSGLLDTRFTIGTNGRVQDVEVIRNTSGSADVARCLRNKIAALYFDPAPAWPLTQSHRFAFCEPGSDEACRLGPVRTPDGVAPDARIVEGVRALETHLIACQAERAPNVESVLSVEVTIGMNGRVTSGWARRVAPAEMRPCAIAPLLNTRVIDELDAPRRVRFTIGLEALDVREARLAQR